MIRFFCLVQSVKWRMSLPGQGKNMKVIGCPCIWGTRLKHKLDRKLEGEPERHGQRNKNWGVRVIRTASHHTTD